ncbi:hypothetical protein [Lapillicoccus sp.]|uniref:hypothetical protein n=1 Tax=Lapillicoccus sp. TaxID=1909287 RepID=UPI0032642957
MLVMPVRRGPISPADVVAGVALSAVVFVIVHVDLYAGDPHGDVLAGLAAMLMTLPVVVARSYPLPATVFAAAAALTNWVVVGQYVRCGAAIPAALWLACAVGLRLRRRPAAIAMASVLVYLFAMCSADAALIPLTFLPLAPAATGFWWAGRTIRSRNDTIARITQQNVKLVATRRRTAQLAVLNERQRITVRLDRDLQGHIDAMATAADAGRAQLDDLVTARATFAAIAAEGRTALTQMRADVDALRDVLARPVLTLGRLEDLVERHHGVLTVERAPGSPPDGVPLPGYRIIEQLLGTFDRGSDPVEVLVRFHDAELELCVAGALASVSTRGLEATVAHQRVVIQGGTLVADRCDGRLQWVASVPWAVG